MSLWTLFRLAAGGLLDLGDVTMKPEIRILAPARILECAKMLAANKQYLAALELLERNSMEFIVHDTFLEARVSVPPKREYYFRKGKSR